MRLHDEFTPRGKFAPRGTLMHIKGAYGTAETHLRLEVNLRHFSPAIFPSSLAP